MSPRRDQPRPRNDGECPYRGLGVFEEEHARYFFGRAAQVQRLLEDLRPSRFLAVIGQSGVGKSSLVRAGLLPQLRSGAMPGSGSWRFVVTRPGAHPTTSLATEVVALQGNGMHDTVDRLGTDERTLHLAAALAVTHEPAGTKLLVLVDQFEEVFTLCTDPDKRSAFVRNEMYAATIPHGHTVVVITMRADFYPQVAQFPEFAQLVQSHHMLVSLMNDPRCARSSRNPRTRRACRSAGPDRHHPRRGRAQTGKPAAAPARAAGDLAQQARHHADAGGLPGDRRRAARAG